MLRFILCLIAATGSCLPAAAGGVVVDSPMDSDPVLVVAGYEKTLAPELKSLWVEVLDGPETELTMRSAEAIAKAHAHGLADMSDTAPQLMQALSDGELPLPVRLSLAQALVTIDAGQAAALLHDQARRGEIDMQQIAEPALAAWKFAPAREVWLARLNDAGGTSYPHRLLAVQCLGTFGEPSEQGLSALLEVAVNRREPPPLRLAAARSMAALHVEGLEEFATAAAARRGRTAVIDRLISAEVLRRHRSDRATEILTTLALDEEPAVAAVALRWLLDADPALVVPLADRVVRNRDAKVRKLGAESLVSVPSVEGIATLGTLLDDPHPDVRAYVRDSLFTLAGEAMWNDPVREAGMKAHALESWRALEQACLLLGALDHEPARDRMLALLKHERPEVLVSAAWGLRKLALPDTLEPALEIAEFRTQALNDGVVVESTYDQVAQLFQMFGEMQHHPADGLMRTYVPKTPTLGEPSRAAAIWALGHLHAGRPDAELTAELESRLSDVASLVPEYEAVRTMSAVTLGRMRAESSLPTLRNFCEADGAFTEPGAASNWAITQLTGESFPQPKPMPLSESDWFLLPLDVKTPDGN